VAVRIGLKLGHHALDAARGVIGGKIHRLSCVPAQGYGV
jgi:hypothetical protein